MVKHHRAAFAAVAVIVASSVFLVGGPASALTAPPEPLTNFKLGVPSDVLEAPGLTAAETAAWQDLTRNKGGAVAGTPRKLVAPAASKGSSRWLKAGGNIGNLFFVLPIAGAVGDAVTNGYFSESAAEGCAMGGGWFGDLTRFAGSLMGFTCDSTDQATQKRDPAYKPINLGASPAGFPVTSTAAPVTLQFTADPFWSSKTMPSGTYQEGWVYPFTLTGDGTVYLFPSKRDATGTLTKQTSPAGYSTADMRTKNLTNAVFPQCVAPTYCLVAAYAGGAKFADAAATYGMSQIAAAYGSAYNVAVPDVPAYVSRAAGTAAPPATPGPGQSAQVTLTTTLTDSSATAKTATCTTVAFRETDLLIPKPCEPTLPSGWTTTKHRTVTMQPLGNTDLTKVTPLQDFDTSAGYQDWRTKYPQCSTQVCLLELESVTAGDCFQLGTTCANWNEDPNKATNYRCLYARTVVDIGKCSRYASTFKPDAQANGTVYAPAPGTPAGPQTSVRPTFEEPSAPTVKDPETKSPCFPQGFGVFNPIEWILKPVGCALETAFVPRPTVVKSFQSRLKVSADASTFGKFTQLAAAVAVPFSTLGNECKGPPWVVNVHFGNGGADKTLYPLSACSAPMSSFAGFTNFLSTGIVGLLGAFAAVRYFAAIVGFVGAGQMRSASGVTFKGSD